MEVHALRADPVATTKPELGNTKLGGVPFQMSFGPGRLFGTFDLTRKDDLDQMIQALNTMKTLLKSDDDGAAN